MIEVDATETIERNVKVTLNQQQAHEMMTTGKMKYALLLNGIQATFLYRALLPKNANLDKDGIWHGTDCFPNKTQPSIRVATDKEIEFMKTLQRLAELRYEIAKEKRDQP